MEQFLIKNEKRAFVMARIATKNEEVALDIVQDTMIKLVTQYANKQEAEWAPLFFRILQSKIVDWHRRQKIRNRWRSWLGKEVKSDISADEFSQSSLENYSSEDHRLPEQDIESLQFSQSLEVAVSHLPLRQQQAFMLRAWEGYSTAETSHIMQCSQGSVKTHYSRALKALRKSLQEFSL